MPVLRILALSEDGSDHAHEVVVALSKSMLKIVDRSVQTQEKKLQFDEQSADARRAMCANLWRSTKEKDQAAIRALMRAIVRQLLIEDDEGRPSGFVFFHYDGDTRFADREQSDARRHFAEFRLKIEQQIRAARNVEGDELYPAGAVWEIGKSFYETVDRMTHCPDLLAALQRTYAMPALESP